MSPGGDGIGGSNGSTIYRTLSLNYIIFTSSIIAIPSLHPPFLLLALSFLFFIPSIY